MPGLMSGAQQAQDRQQRRDKHAVGPLWSHPKVGNPISGTDEKQQRHHRQHRPREGIEGQPCVRRNRGRIQEQPKYQREMHEAEGRQQPGPGAIARPQGRERRSHQGHNDEKESFHSRSVVSLRVSSESKARWMRSTMMPMTNTPTVRSSRMPASTSRGIEWISSRPNR